MNRLYDSTQPAWERKWFIEIKFTAMNKLVSTLLGVHCSQMEIHCCWVASCSHGITFPNENHAYLHATFSIQSDKEWIISKFLKKTTSPLSSTLVLWIFCPFKRCTLRELLFYCFWVLWSPHKCFYNHPLASLEQNSAILWVYNDYTVPINIFHTIRNERMKNLQYCWYEYKIKDKIPHFVLKWLLLHTELPANYSEIKVG